ncbi:MAG: hypothetical protein AB9907_07310 [Flexilinea sp.]
MKVKLISIFFAFLTIGFNIAPQIEPLVFEGSGNDVIFGPISIEDYPIIKFETACLDENDDFKITLFDADQEIIKDISRSCEEQGSFLYMGFTYFPLIEDDSPHHDPIDYLEVSNSGDFKLSFLPLNSVIYKAPVVVEGTGSSVFFIEDPGRMLTITKPSDSFINIYQLSAEPLESNDIAGYFLYGYQDQKILCEDDKCGINPAFPIFQVFGSGDWELDFHELVYEAPVKINGTGGSFFIVEKPGKLISISFSGDFINPYFYFYQQNELDWDDIILISDSFYGKKVINPDLPFFRIHSSGGDWEINFIDTGEEK